MKNEDFLKNVTGRIAGGTYILSHSNLLDLTPHRWCEVMMGLLTHPRADFAERLEAASNLDPDSVLTSVFYDSLIADLLALMPDFFGLDQTLKLYREIAEPRWASGVRVAPFHQVHRAVFDLQGNFLARVTKSKDAQTVYGRDGTRFAYRPSGARAPETRRANEAAKGYYTGTAALPVLIRFVEYRPRTTPDGKAITLNRDSILGVDNGL